MNADDAEKNTGNSQKLLLDLQAWLHALYSSGHAIYDELGIVRLDRHAGSRFTLGYLNNEAFIGFGRDELKWARLIPWEYAATYRGKKELNLVARPLETEQDPTPPLAISFELDKISDALTLAAHGCVFLRQISAENNRDLLVTKSHFGQIPVVMLERDENLFETGQRNANKARAKGGFK